MSFDLIQVKNINMQRTFKFKHQLMKFHCYIQKNTLTYDPSHNVVIICLRIVAMSINEMKAFIHNTIMIEYHNSSYYK